MLQIASAAKQRNACTPSLPPLRLSGSGTALRVSRPAITGSSVTTDRAGRQWAAHAETAGSMKRPRPTLRRYSLAFAVVACLLFLFAAPYFVTGRHADLGLKGAAVFAASRDSYSLSSPVRLLEAPKVALESGTLSVPPTRTGLARGGEVIAMLITGAGASMTLEQATFTADFSTNEATVSSSTLSGALAPLVATFQNLQLRYARRARQRGPPQARRWLHSAARQARREGDDQAHGRAARRRLLRLPRRDRRLRHDARDPARGAERHAHDRRLGDERSAQRQPRGPLYARREPQAAVAAGRARHPQPAPRRALARRRLASRRGPGRLPRQGAARVGQPHGRLPEGQRADGRQRGRRHVVGELRRRASRDRRHPWLEGARPLEVFPRPPRPRARACSRSSPTRAASSFR